MCSKKKDLEIVCNLQWANKVHNGGDRSNIVGVYDIPSTTLNWEIFKSYLLKNSGTPGDDVKVSYCPNNDREYPIKSQEDFLIALYAFRRKARNGEIINLKLDRISQWEKFSKELPTSYDVQTQFDTINIDCSNSSLSAIDSAPQWFTNYMTEFKKEIITEVSASVSGYISTMKSHGAQSYHLRKSKAESSKRIRKHPFILYEAGNEKNIKLEKKVQSKLEKLEINSKKLKEKKMTLLTKSSDSDAGHSSTKSNSDTLLDVDMSKMNGAPLFTPKSLSPQMIGKEIYRQTWDIINNGSLPWTSDTKLHFTWGSASLKPVERIVPCPPLKPGKTGSIDVLMNIPKTGGQYESYWHFHHKGRKFGHWLGCHITVNEVNHEQPGLESFWDSYGEMQNKYGYLNSLFKTQKVQNIPKNDEVNISNGLSEIVNSILAVSDKHKKVKDNQVVEACNNSTNDQTENQKEIISTASAVVEQACSNSANFQRMERATSSQTEIEEVVLNTSPSKIQIVENVMGDIEPSNCYLDSTGNEPKEPKQNKQMDGFSESDDNNNNTEGALDSSSESISKIDEDTTSNSTFNDMVMINFADEMEGHDTGYAYVLVDGSKVPIPKKYLRTDFLESAEDAPNPALITKVNSDSNEALSASKDIDKEKCLPEDKNVTEKYHNTLTNYCDSWVQSSIPDIYDRFDLLETGEDASNPAVFAKMNSEHGEVTSSKVIDENNIKQFGEDENISIKECNTPLSYSCDSKYTAVAGSELSYSFVSQEPQTDNGWMQSIPPMTSSSTLKDYIDDGNANSRIFVFPQNCPGYEIISEHPAISEPKQIHSDDGCQKTTTQYSFSKYGESNNHLMRCNIYQLDSSDDSPKCSCHLYSSEQNEKSSENSASSQNQDFKTGNSNEFSYVPNYQQTPPELRPKVRNQNDDTKPEQKEPSRAGISTSYSFECSSENTYSTSKEGSTSEANMPQANIPSPGASAPMASVVSGAMTIASSALNTARNVVNRIIPPRTESVPGVWMNGHWVSTNIHSLRESNLQALAEMGFQNRDLNATLLGRYDDDISQVISELIQ